MLACKTHPTEPPIEIDIEHWTIERCPKCDADKRMPIASSEIEQSVILLKKALRDVLSSEKKSVAEVRVEFDDKVVKERDR